jgi:hypothetical protein
MQTRPISSRIQGLFCLLARTLLAPVTAWSDNWDWGLRAGVNAEYDDNPTLIADERQARLIRLPDGSLALVNPEREIESTFRMLGSLNLKLLQIKANRSIRLEPRVTRDYYTDSDQKDLESTDFNIPLTVSWQDPRFTRSVNFRYAERNVLSDDPTVLDTGDGQDLFRADDKLTTYTASGFATWSATLRDSFNLSAGYVDNDYDLDYTGRADTESYNASLGYTRSITRRLAVGASVSYFTSEAERLACFPDFGLPSPSFEPCRGSDINVRFFNNFDTTSYNANLTYSFSENTSFRGEIGKSKNDQELISKTLSNIEFISDESSSRTDNFELQLSRTFERGEITLTARRSLRPAADGSTLDADSLNLEGEYELNERIKAEWGLRGEKSENVRLSDIDDSRLVPERKNFTGDLRLNYQLTRKWSINLGYKYRWRDNESVTSPVFNDPIFGPIRVPPFIESFSANSNTYTLGVFYAFKQIQQ